MTSPVTPWFNVTVEPAPSEYAKVNPFPLTVAEARGNELFIFNVPPLLEANNIALFPLTLKLLAVLL